MRLRYFAYKRCKKNICHTSMLISEGKRQMDRREYNIRTYLKYRERLYAQILWPARGCCEYGNETRAFKKCVFNGWLNSYSVYNKGPVRRN